MPLRVAMLLTSREMQIAQRQRRPEAEKSRQKKICTHSGKLLDKKSKSPVRK